MNVHPATAIRLVRTDGDLVRLAVAGPVDRRPGRRTVGIRHLRRRRAVAVPLGGVRLGSRLRGHRRAGRVARRARAGATAGGAARALPRGVRRLHTACVPEFWSTLPPPVAWVEAESFFSWPGAFSEFPDPPEAFSC